MPTGPVIVPHPNTIRGPIESEHNALRDAREKKFVDDRVALEAVYHADLANIQSDKEDALVAAGLNADGGIPDDYGVALSGTAPENTVAPTITGTPKVGEVLTVHDGTWTGEPTPDITYQWQKANDGAGAGVGIIAGATASTYTPVVGDVDKFIRVTVSGMNVIGSHLAYTAYTAVIAAA